jgi:hypothetical protein
LHCANDDPVRHAAKENFVFWNWWGERALESLNAEKRCEIPDWLPDEDDLAEIEGSRPGKKRSSQRADYRRSTRHTAPTRSSAHFTEGTGTSNLASVFDHTGWEEDGVLRTSSGARRRDGRA